MGLSLNQHIFSCTLIVCLVLCTAGCNGRKASSSGAEASASFGISSGTLQRTELIDSNGHSAAVAQDARVVSLYGSFAEAWILAGGTLVGATQDAIEERRLNLGDDTLVVGTVKSPDWEKILSLNPDLVILSSDIASQTELTGALTRAGIEWLSFRTDTFAEYKFMMRQFCTLTGRWDLFETNVTDVESRIDAILQRIPQDEADKPSILLMRAFSTGVKAKKDDNLAGVILKEFGCRNIAEEHPSLLEELSVEQVITDDPDDIFVLTMGDEGEALAYLQEHVLSHPAWSGLSAIISNRYYVLPKDLFHNKPNNRWDESYEYLAKILWPEAFGE